MLLFANSCSETDKFRAARKGSGSLIRYPVNTSLFLLSQLYLSFFVLLQPMERSVPVK